MINNPNWRRGTELDHDSQREVLAAYVHRFTGDHKPAWAREPMPNGKPYPVQFASDADWLANTLFEVTKAGRLNRRQRYCYSRPTWPNGKGDEGPARTEKADE